MAIESIEYEFDDETKKPTPVEVEGNPNAFELEVDVETDDELEIVDDTPEADRGRTPSPSPDEVSDEELENYSDKVRKRIQKFSKGFNDERRAKESAERQSSELEAYTKGLLEKIKGLEGTQTQNQQTMLAQVTLTAEAVHAAARKAYKEAYEAGNAEELADAADKFNEARNKLDKIKNFKFPPRQSTETAVQQPQPSPAAQQQPRQEDPKAVAWTKENLWFGVDKEMTAFALGAHATLVESGVDSRSDEYYEKINTRMRKTFPEQFEDLNDIEDDKPGTPANPALKKPSPTVVASATRSTPLKKFKLTQSQVAIAKRLGVSPLDYAKQVAALEKQNG